MEVGQNISTYPKSKKHTYYFVPSYTNVLIILSISIIVLVLSPQFTSSIVQEFSYTNARRWSVWPCMGSFPYDYPAVLWINYYVHQEDLILIDRSIASNWILSFSLKNLTFHLHMDSDQTKRLYELEIVWNKPYENGTIYQILKKYNVRYIFVTSEPGYFLPELHGGAFLYYTAKPFTPSEYISIFDTYPFLKIVFRLGYTTVYKVDIT